MPAGTRSAGWPDDRHTAILTQQFNPTFQPFFLTILLAQLRVGLDIRRVETIKSGTESVGNRVRVKVVKNKVASPFRVAEFDVMYGEGVSKEGGLLDVGVAMSVVDKTGAWFTFAETRLGQGREASKEFLRQNPAIGTEIESRIRAKVSGGDVALPVEGIEEAE